MEDKMVEVEEHQSKIVSIKIKNFMSIKDGLVEFDDSNIISLCGYNDSGKSAITRLLEVMFYNAYSTDQVKFITDGEDYWSGTITFSDGVEYTRRKYEDGKSLWELKKGDKELFSNLLSNGTYAAMPDTPEVIAKYLGVIQDELTGEELNVRRNTDRLFLINTSGGDNYKILNSVLRSDVLSAASKSLNDDKNKLNAEVSEKQTVKSVLQEQYDSYEIPPEEELAEMKNYIKNLEDYQGRVTRLGLLMEENERKHSMALYEELSPVDVSRVVALQGIMDLANQKNVAVYDALGKVDTERLSMLQKIFELAEQKNVAVYDEVKSVDTERLEMLQDIMEKATKIHGTVYNELTPIDIARVKAIEEVKNSYLDYANAYKAYVEVMTKLKNTRNELVTLSQQYNFKICKNCGSIVT